MLDQKGAFISLSAAPLLNRQLGFPPSSLSPPRTPQGQEVRSGGSQGQAWAAAPGSPASRRSGRCSGAPRRPSLAVRIRPAPGRGSWPPARSASLVRPHPWHPPLGVRMCSMAGPSPQVLARPPALALSPQSGGRAGGGLRPGGGGSWTGSAPRCGGARAGWWWWVRAPGSGPERGFWLQPPAPPAAASALLARLGSRSQRRALPEEGQPRQGLWGLTIP